MTLCDLCLAVPYTSLAAFQPCDWFSSEDHPNCELPVGVWNVLQNTPESVGVLFHKDTDALALLAKSCLLCGVVQQGVRLWMNYWDDGVVGKDSLTAKRQQLWLTGCHGGAFGFYVWA